MPEHFYVYPEYLLKSSSRASGRRVPAAAAIAELSLEEIARAARELGFAVEVEEGKAYPRQFHRYGGRLKVGKKAGMTKPKFLRALAAALAGVAPASR